MPAKMPKFSYPVPANKSGQLFSSAEALLLKLEGESSGHYLVGSQGMWHGGIHITDTTIPWCALSTDSEAERAYYKATPCRGEQFIRCMADGEIVAFRVCRDSESEAIKWLGGRLQLSTSFVLVKHGIQTGETDASSLTFYTLYMNLAPFKAYVQTGIEVERKTAGPQRYYSSIQAVQSGVVSGVLSQHTQVILSDNIITRSRDGRQFTEITLISETQNTAGATLASGMKIWTVSDQGCLNTGEPAALTPAWWSACLPAYRAEPVGRINCTSRTNWRYYLSRDDVLQGKKAGELTANFPLSYTPDNSAQQMTRPGKTTTDASRQFRLVTLGQAAGKQQKGDRVWVVSDGDSLIPSQAAEHEQPVFGDVVVPSSPIPIAAGDNIGHMGFYQLPEENGKRSRYQVHIECLSMDDNLPSFLTNPERVGRDSPVFLKYPKGAVLYMKSHAGTMEATERKTQAPGLLTLSGIPVMKTGGQVTHYHIHPEGGWLAAASIQTIPQYALDERGFLTLDKAPESFNLIDGQKQPDNVVKGILEQMHKAAKQETRVSHKLNEYNYQRLLELIDKAHDGHYREGDYLQAIHNRSYRDHLYRVIAKHPSEWYYDKDAPLWKRYLNPLTHDAPLWKKYSETFIDKMRWMHKVPGMGPELWHMHPVVFLDAIIIKNKIVEKGKLTYDAEGNNIPGSLFYSRVIHWPGNNESGVTLGRGYDMGHRTEESIYQDMIASGIESAIARNISQASGCKGHSASVFVKNNKLRIGEITEDQQINLFNIIYPGYIDRAIANYNHWMSKFNFQRKWESLDAKIKDVLVDFVYQGFTKGPNPMLAGANNNKQELINYIRNTPEIFQYEPGRRRVSYLEGAE